MRITPASARSFNPRSPSPGRPALPSSSTTTSGFGPKRSEDAHGQGGHRPDPRTRRPRMPIALRHECLPFAVATARTPCRDAVPAVAVAAVREQPSEIMPQAPHTPCTDEAPTGSSILSTPSMNSAETTTSMPGDEADEDRRGRRHERARGRDGHHAREHAVAQHADVGRAEAHAQVDVGAERARRRREHRVDGHDGDARVHARQRRARVEAEPAEREDERAEHDHRHVVAGIGRGLAVLVVLADARAEHLGADEARRRRPPCAPPSCPRSRRGRGRARSSCRAATASRRPTPSCRRSDT